jgi:DNA-binding transcriptional LysR family regulator
MDRLDRMMTFMRVAELESFTRAGASLGLPKASVSTAVRDLETAVGARLLQRTTRRVQLTQDGLSFYERCKDLLADVEEVSTMFQRGDAAVTGRLRVDMSTGIARILIVPRLPGFLARHPGLEIELSCTDRRVDVVREGFDCVIRVGALADSGLIARRIGTFTLVNCASPAYLERHGQPKKPEDLTAHRLVHYVATLGVKPDGFEYFDGERYRTLRVQGAIIVDNADAYLAACLAGLGIIQAPLMGVREHLKKGRLVEILPRHRAEPMPVSLVYPHRRNLARRVQAFMDWVEEQMRDYAE